VAGFRLIPDGMIWGGVVGAILVATPLLRHPKMRREGAVPAAATS
jgi:hypothetical protein